MQGKIRIDVVEVKRIISRIEEIKNQLKSTMDENNKYFEDLAVNLKSAQVNKVVRGYTQKSEELTQSINNSLSISKQYLEIKVSNYATMTEDANKRFGDTKSLIDTIEE